MKEVSKTQVVRTWSIFLGAIAVALILIYFGSLLLFTGIGDVDTTVLYLLAVALLAGALLYTMPEPAERWHSGLLVLALGVYTLLRANGTIRIAWITTLVGLASWLAALLVVYFAHPTQSHK